MEYRKRFLYKVVTLLFIMLFAVAGCVEEWDDPTAPSGPVYPSPTPSPDTLTGTVTGTINGRPIVGAIVAARGKTARTESDGTFRLPGIGEGIFSVAISGGNIYPRTATVNTAGGYSVSFNAIEIQSAFSLKFYRELARGNHPDERDLFPTHRWVNPTPPTFYIDTDASVTLDGIIDQEQKDRVRSVLAQVVPVFTGNFYPSVNIEERPFTRLDLTLDIPDNAVVISFDDNLAMYDAYGYTQTDPDFASPTTSVINKAVIRVLDGQQFYTTITMEEIIAHEMGHGFGFRHAEELPTVMLPVGAYGGLFSSADRLHMAIVYQRPAGNFDIDNDPVPSAKIMGQPFGRQSFVDQRGNFSLSSELLEQLQALPDKLSEEERRELRNARK